MPLSFPETVIYTKMFKGSPNLTGDTMDMENVVKLCRDLGWTEKDYPTPTIQRWSKDDGPLNCENFLKMFEPQNENAVWKAKYTRDFATIDTDNSGKICSSELAKYISVTDNVSEETAKENAESLMTYVDENNDKRLDLNEFLSIMLP